MDSVVHNTSYANSALKKEEKHNRVYWRNCIKTNKVIFERYT